MKIERINENQIRCTLSSFDLSVRNLNLGELAYGSEKARNLFREMIQKASNEVGFDAEDIPLMVEAIPLSNESVMLVITKIEDPEELDTRFQSFPKWRMRIRTTPLEASPMNCLRGRWTDGSPKANILGLTGADGMSAPASPQPDELCPSPASQTRVYRLKSGPGGSGCQSCRTCLPGRKYPVQKAWLFPVLPGSVQCRHGACWSLAESVISWQNMVRRFASSPPRRPTIRSIMKSLFSGRHCRS